MSRQVQPLLLRCECGLECGRLQHVQRRNLRDFGQKRTVVVDEVYHDGSNCDGEDVVPE